tara:strand:- start:207 stop:797 length:591 start_codon:yes stop_codon:yes gene_type:complete
MSNITSPAQVLRGYPANRSVFATSGLSSSLHERSINILNNDVIDGGSDFDHPPTNNSDGGGTTWSISGNGDAIFFQNTSGGHGGIWQYVYMEEGYWCIKGSVRLTNTDATIHSSTSANNYKYTHSFRFYIDSGPDTGTLKWDADAAATAVGVGCRMAFCGVPVYMTAGYRAVKYATNGYNGVQQVYITNLDIVRVS